VSLIQACFHRSIKPAITLLAIVCFARWEPVLRFYAHHAPVWGAKGYTEPPTDFAAKVVEGARRQIGTVYDDGYAKIAYPGGDVSSERGACSDVVVRALRHAGLDLQKLMHEDMVKSPSSYPGLSVNQLDTNIDHRRARNQMHYLTCHGQVLTNEASSAPSDQWLPGDLVYWRQWNNRLHVGVLSDRTNADGLPLVIHNGSVCIEENCLTDWDIIGHYRLP